MKKIGLVGGLGPASTVDYYLGLVDRYRKEHGEDRYPELVIESVDMHRYIEAIGAGEYDKVSDFLVDSLSHLKAAGAELAAVTANTVHIVWDRVCDRFPLPVISIVDTAVCEIRRCGYERVLVFGTEFTMNSGLYEDSLTQNGIVPILPDDADKKRIGGLIYPNLENGIVIEEDRQKMIDLAEKYIKEYRADAMLLGCTEIPLAIKEGDVSVPTLNTTEIHVDAIYRKAMVGEG